MTEEKEYISQMLRRAFLIFLAVCFVLVVLGSGKKAIIGWLLGSVIGIWNFKMLGKTLNRCLEIENTAQAGLSLKRQSLLRQVLVIFVLYLFLRKVEVNFFLLGAGLLLPTFTLFVQSILQNSKKFMRR